MSRDIKAGGAYVELLLKSQSFVAGLKSASSRLKAFGDSAKRIGSLGFLGGGGGGGLGALFAGAGAAAALAYPIKLAANLEVAEAQFTSLTGSAQKAAEIIAGIEQFSATSLISVDELQRVSQLLLGYGAAADSVIPSVKALAEISRGNAERFNLLALAFGQTTAKTRLYAAEVRQFVESGWNPLQQIAETTGETMAQVSKRLEAGGISANELAAALHAAVGPGGRFNGLLASMGKTASGAFSRLLTGLKLAIRPLGQELLPAIRGVLETANEWTPAFAKIVKENAKVATVVGLAVVSFVGAAAALTSFGIAVQVAGFGLAGVATALGLLLNPVTLLTGVVAGLAYWFATSAEWGQTMVASLAQWFGKLRDIAAEAFGGIADALAAGNLSAAANIAWLGLKAAWLQGTKGLSEIWESFKQAFMQTTIDIVFGAMGHWETFVAGVKTLLTGLKSTATDTVMDIGAFLNKIGKSDEEKAAIDRANELAKKGFQGKAKADLAAIALQKEQALADLEAARKLAQESQESSFFGRMDQINKDIAAAKAELAKAREDAAKARADGVDIPGAPKFDPANFNMNAAALKDEIFGSFSGAALQAQGGVGGVQNKILDELKAGNKANQKLGEKQLAAIKAAGVIGP